MRIDEQRLLTSVLAAALFLLGTACQGNAPDDGGTEGPPGELTVESTLGDRVAVDGEPVDDANVGESFEVSPGEHHVMVRVEGTGWSDPLDVDVEADGTATVEIPWSALPTGDRVEARLADRETLREPNEGNDGKAGKDGNGEKGNQKPKLYSASFLKKFAELETSESPSGPYVTVRHPKGPLTGGLEFRDGDKLYTADGHPTDSIAPLASALQAYYADDSDPPSWTILRDGRKTRVVPDLLQVPDDDAPDTSGGESDSDADSSRGAEPGELSIYSKPKGVVVVDGESTGQTTPATLELAAGDHDIAVDWRDNGESEPKSVELESGERTKLLFRR